MIFLTCLSKVPWHIEEKKKRRERERWVGRKMSRHRNTFVSGGVRCVAVIYGSTYVCDMKGHSSHSSSVCGSTTLAEEFQCNTWAIHHGGRPSVAWQGGGGEGWRSAHPPRILRTLGVGIRMHHLSDVSGGQQRSEQEQGPRWKNNL